MLLSWLRNGCLRVPNFCLQCQSKSFRTIIILHLFNSHHRLFHHWTSKSEGEALDNAEVDSEPRYNLIPEFEKSGKETFGEPLDDYKELFINYLIHSVITNIYLFRNPYKCGYLEYQHEYPWSIMGPTTYKEYVKTEFCS